MCEGGSKPTYEQIKPIINLVSKDGVRTSLKSIFFRGNPAFLEYKTLRLKGKLCWVKQIIDKNGVVLALQNAGVFKWKIINFLN